MTRLDVLVAAREDCSRQYAQELIKNGTVSVQGVIVRKPGVKADACNVEVAAYTKKYVSRGGYKLESGLSTFSIDACDRICADIGASTGGFTDCLLQHGAKLVYAIENGNAQLHESLREDPRVIGMENTDIRKLDCDTIEKCDIAVVDLSFISLCKVLEHVKKLLAPAGQIICLVKPQFEAGLRAVNKSGVVKNEKLRLLAVDNVMRYGRELGFEVDNAIESPIRGGDGNIEYLLHLRRPPC